MKTLPQPKRIAPFASRDEAALLLAGKLDAYRNTDAIMLTVSSDFGTQVAGHLGLPTTAMPCLEIRHPANRNLSIGSVCLKNVVLHDAGCDIPQEYIQHAIARLRARIQRDMKQGGDPASQNYRGKTLIIVADWLKTADRVLACLNHIREDAPSRIVIATAVASPQAVPALRNLADELIYLVEDDEVSHPQYYFGPDRDERPGKPARGPASNVSAAVRPSRSFA